MAVMWEASNVLLYISKQIIAMLGRSIPPEFSSTLICHVFRLKERCQRECIVNIAYYSA